MQPVRRAVPVNVTGNFDFKATKAFPAIPTVATPAIMSRQNFRKASDVSTYSEQLLPHDTDAEEAVIGAMLIDSGAFAEVAVILQPSDFYRERNRLCFQAALDLFNRSQAIDQATLAGELSRTGLLEAAGGVAYLSHLVAITPTSIHATDYARNVARTATMRRLIDAGNRIIALGYQDTADTGLTLRQAMDAVFAVQDSANAQDFLTLKQIYDQYLQDQADAAEPQQSNNPVMSGFPDLDELLGGLQPSDLIILGARPSMGKSTLALNIALAAAKSGQTAAIFSLEMSASQLATRILSAEARVNSHRLRLELTTNAEARRIIDAVGYLSDLPVHIDDTPNQSITQMLAKARRLANTEDLSIIVVDYLQLAQAQGQRYGSNRTQEISEISRALKAMARDLNAVLIACSQLNRLVENRPSHRPMLSDLRDSGSLEQDADVVMFIHREDAYITPEEWQVQRPGEPYPKGMAEIIVAKHRNGPTGSVPLYFREELVTFEQYESAPPGRQA